MLLMEEEGFLDNISAEELMGLARDSPDLVRQAVSPCPSLLSLSSLELSDPFVYQPHCPYLLALPQSIGLTNLVRTGSLPLQSCRVCTTHPARQIKNRQPSRLRKS